jgi:hypothetical protein
LQKLLLDLITLTENYCSQVNFQGYSISKLISNYSNIGYNTIAVDMACTKQLVMINPIIHIMLELCTEIYTRANKMDEWNKIMASKRNIHGSQKKNLAKEMSQSL